MVSIRIRQRFEIVEFQGVRYSEDGTAAAEGIVKALARWATCKRLTIRAPKLLISVVTLSPPWNSGILCLRMGPYVPTMKFFSGDPGRAIHQILDMRKYLTPRESDSSDF